VSRPEVAATGFTDATYAEGAPALVPTVETPVAALRTPFRPLLEQALHYGNAQSPLVRVVPDDRGMWRMIWPDGRVFDLANLVRIKDAAEAICERGPPARNRARFHWKRQKGTQGQIPLKRA